MSKFEDYKTIYPTERYLFFDTETSGLPNNFNAPSSNTKNWPRLVQLSWIVTDDKGNKLKECNYIIRPEGFRIPMEATRIHGISNQTAILKGVNIKKVLNEFMEDAGNSSLLIGHNLSFDKKIVGAELIRMGYLDTLKNKPSFCTMESTVDFCKISNYTGYGYKFPKLQELYRKLFGQNFGNEHDASADVAATFKCFWELKKRGIINPLTSNDDLPF